MKNISYKLISGAGLVILIIIDSITQDNMANLLILLPLFLIFSFTWISIVMQFNPGKTRDKINYIFLKSSIAYLVFLVIIPLSIRQLNFFQDKDFQGLVFYLLIGFMWLTYGAGEMKFTKSKSNLKDKSEGVVENVS